MNVTQKYRKQWTTRPLEEIIKEIEKLVIALEVERNPMLKTSLRLRVTLLESLERDRLKAGEVQP